jgi:hypothetical protein
LPTFIFRKYYPAQQLQDEIKIRLRSARLVTAKLLGGLQVPYFELELEAFNMSPYLDLNVTGLLSSLAACREPAAETFAECDHWGGFNLPCGTSRPFHIRYWLNEYQDAVVSTYVRERWALQLFVVLWAESRIGMVRSFKTLVIKNPTVR